MPPVFSAEQDEYQRTDSEADRDTQSIWSKCWQL